RSKSGDVLGSVAGNAAELLDALGELQRVIVLFFRVMLEIVLDLGARDVRRHEIVVPVLKKRGPFTSQRAIEQGDDLFRIGLVARRQRAILEVLLRVLNLLLQAILPDHLAAGTATSRRHLFLGSFFALPTGAGRRPATFGHSG